MNVLNTVYFSHDEMKSILEHYGKVIRDNNYPFKEKIPYNSYRRLYGCSKGITVIEDNEKMLQFYDAAFEYSEPQYATDGMGNKLIRIQEEKQPLILATEPGFDFHDFFLAYYLCYHSDYHPQKKKEEDKDMQLNSNVTDWTLTWDNNTSTSSSGLAYDSNAKKEYDCVWTTTSAPVYTDAWTNIKDSWNITLDDVNVIESLKGLAGAAQSAAGAINGFGNEIKKLNDKNEKENGKMKGLNFDFGPCTNDSVRMSMYGIAIKNQASEWVSYNPATAQIVNVDIFNFEGGKYMFKMPVAPKDVVVGDVIVHNRKAMIVLDKDENGFIVVDPHAGEEKKVVPTSNCFGFNFITKIISMLDGFAAAPDADAPFGNMLPFMLMADGKDIDPIMMMLMMNQNDNMGDVFSNPMMLYFLCGDKMNKDSMLPLMFMMSANKPNKGKNSK